MGSGRRRVYGRECVRLPGLDQRRHLDEARMRVRCHLGEGGGGGGRKKLECRGRGRRYPSDRCSPSAIF